MNLMQVSLFDRFDNVHDKFIERTALFFFFCVLSPLINHFPRFYANFFLKLLPAEPAEPVRMHAQSPIHMCTARLIEHT